MAETETQREGGGKRKRKRRDNEAVVKRVEKEKGRGGCEINVIIRCGKIYIYNVERCRVGE